MLIILTLCLAGASILTLCVKKSKESLLMCGLCMSLMLEICGVMIFIAKKGGISSEVLQFLYISKNIQHQIRYFLITLDQLGFLIALGRTLFPMFLFMLAIHYSMTQVCRRNRKIQIAISILPMLSLLFYIPGIYRRVCGENTVLRKVLTDGTFLWITGYLLLAVILLVWEYRAINLRFRKRQFLQVGISMVALTGIYMLYYRQDPGQVYYFHYDLSAWSRGIGYLQFDPSLFSYFLLVIISIICCFFGFYSLLRYTRGSFEDVKESVIMERKIDMARVGVSMFVHGMKNQLLASNVIYKRIGQLYEQPEPDLVRLKEYVDSLEEVNQAMLVRMEELYRCVKTSTIFMMPVSVEEIFRDALTRFEKKYPEIQIETDCSDVSRILADQTHLGEAIYNLLINAREALPEQTGEEGSTGRPGRIQLECRNESRYTVIEVRDNGRGIPKEKIKKVFEPFYTSKNSNYNWGMGLYYVREIVKSHQGLVRAESRPGEGTSFYILLPRYE